MKRVFFGTLFGVVVGVCVLSAADVGSQVEREWLVQDAMVRQSPGGKALAKGGQVSTRSDAAGGVDGMKNGGFGFHTPLEDQPWWQVDLGKVHALGQVVVYNRAGTDANRAFRLQVLLSDDGKAWRTVYKHDGKPFGGVTDKKPLRVPLEAAKARLVRIQLADRNYFHLDEIEVYGAADGKTNLALRKPADQSSASQWSTGPRQPAAAKAKPAPKPTGDDPIDEAIARGRKLIARRRADGVDVTADARVFAELTGKTPPTEPE